MFNISSDKVCHCNKKAMLSSDKYNLEFQNQLPHNQISQIFEQCCDNYDSSLKSGSFVLEQKSLFADLKAALNTCVQLPFDSLNFSLIEYKKASAYKDGYLFVAFKDYPWLNQPSYINSITTNILSDLSTLVIDAGWLFFNNFYLNLSKIDAQLNSIDKLTYINSVIADVLDIVLKKTLDRSNANLMMAYTQLNNNDLPEPLMEYFVSSFLNKAKESIDEFLKKSKQFGSLDDNSDFLLSKTLSIIHYLRANLFLKLKNDLQAEDSLRKCDAFNKQYDGFINYDEPLLKFFKYADIDTQLQRIHDLQQLAAPQTEQYSEKKKKAKAKKKHKNTLTEIVLPKPMPLVEETTPVDDAVINADSVLIASTYKEQVIGLEKIDINSQKSLESVDLSTIETQQEETILVNDAVTNTDSVLKTATYKDRVKEKKRLKKEKKSQTSLESVDNSFSESLRPATKLMGNDMVARSRDQEPLTLMSKTDRVPVCYNNEDGTFKILIDEMSRIFKISECDGYMFGSGNFKQNPSDLDIVIPNIQSSEDMQRVYRLIDSFMICGGGNVLEHNPITGEYGYRIDGRYTIPMKWSNLKLDFNISPHAKIVDHALGTDFSVGALYYNFRDKCLYQFDQLNSLNDFDNKFLNTISDPMQSFSEDPRRIFRGVRLMASEGFDFSMICKNAINALFSEKNIFKYNMTGGRLNHQLDLLFQSSFTRENISKLDELGLLTKILECLEKRTEQGDPKAYNYRERLLVNTYDNKYSYSPCFFSPHNTSSNGVNTEKSPRMTHPPY